MGIKITKAEIDTAHRLPSKENSEAPPFIIKLTQTDKRLLNIVYALITSSVESTENITQHQKVKKS